MVLCRASPPIPPSPAPPRSPKLSRSLPCPSVQSPNLAFNTGKSMGYANAKQKKEGKGFVACTKSAASRQGMELDRFCAHSAH